MGVRMTLSALMIALTDREVELRADGDRIAFRPASAVPEDLRAAIAEHRAEILAKLRGDVPADLRLDAIDKRVVEAIRTGDTHVLRPTDTIESSPDIPAGWTRQSWHDRLRYMATACEPYVPQRAAELRAWADRINKTTSANKEGAA